MCCLNIPSYVILDSSERTTKRIPTLQNVHVALPYQVTLEELTEPSKLSRHSVGTMLRLQIPSHVVLGTSNATFRAQPKLSRQTFPLADDPSHVLTTFEDKRGFGRQKCMLLDPFSCRTTTELFDLCVNSVVKLFRIDQVSLRSSIKDSVIEVFRL